MVPKLDKKSLTSLFLVCCTVALIVMVISSGCTTVPSVSQNEIHIAAQQDKIGTALAEFVENQKDIQIPITVSLFPPEEWDTLAYQEYDLIVVDITAISSLAEQNAITPITLLADGALNKTTFDTIMLNPYIIGSELYGLPLQPDMLGYVIWTEHFESEDDRDAFNVTYGYDIGNPLTYHDLTNITEFISHPENGKYGIGIAGNEPTAMQNLYESIVYSYGSELSDEDKREAEALFQNLMSHTPPEHMNWNREDVTDALLQSKVRSAITWFSEFETLSSPKNNPNNDTFIFLALPGSWNSKEAFHTASILGGKVFAVPNTSSENDELTAFLSWFYHPDTQLKWMETGMQPVIHEIQESWEYLMANGYNAAYIISLRNTWKDTS